MRLDNLMEMPPWLPGNTVAEFIAHARANPGKLSFASSGNGTSVHMSAELFKAMTGTEIVHVPYRGSSAAYPDLMTGKVHVLFDNLPGSIEFARTGKLRALGVTTAKRWDSVPDIPAIAETVPGYEASVWYGIAAPKGTPPDVIARVNKEFVALLRDPKFQAYLEKQSVIAAPTSPEEFVQFIAQDRRAAESLISIAKTPKAEYREH
jgi:tripartite-type tricarboxylate transporter receptor subunit TctC